MRNSTTWRLAALVIGVAWLAAIALICKPASAQETATKTFCVGCSADGKTPMTADAHPDFSGYWGVKNQQADLVLQRGQADGSILFDFGTESDHSQRCAPLDQSCQQPNQPPYNAEYMKKVRAIAADEFFGVTPEDPFNQCKALGVPRSGFPQMIVQTPNMMVFFYENAPYSTYRLIYMGGRPHPDMKEYETTYLGDSIAHWEGSTLVIDTIGFNDDTWLGGSNFGNAQFTSIHSEKEHTTERLTRNGDVISYDVTVEDPDALTKPWVLATRQIKHAGPGMEVPGEDALEENICLPTGHIVKPTSEDKDIRNHCAYRCNDGYHTEK